MQYIAPLAKLIEHFRALPGIGNKTAVRLAYHVLDMDAEQAKKLATAIIEAKEKQRQLEKQLEETLAKHKGCSSGCLGMVAAIVTVASAACWIVCLII